MMNRFRRVAAAFGARLMAIDLVFVASAVAFYAFLAVPASVAALVALYGVSFGYADALEHFELVRTAIPASAQAFVADLLTATVSSSEETLGWAAVVGFALALLGVRAAAGALMSAFTMIAGLREDRSFMRFQATALALALGGLLIGTVALALLALLPALFAWLPEQVAEAARVLRWPVLAAVVMLAIAALYRFAPARRKPQRKFVTWGAVAATAAWLIGSAGLAVYVAEFAYGEAFGAAGGVAALLLWLQLSAASVLAGAELDNALDDVRAQAS